MLMTENFCVKFTLIGTFGTCFVPKMDDEAVTVINDDRKPLIMLKLLVIYIQTLIRRFSVMKSLLHLQ